MDYEATAGTLVVQEEEAKHKANVFFVAYTKCKVENLSQRPIAFAFNGGPGSSSVWLHMGMLGTQAASISAPTAPRRRRPTAWWTTRPACSIGPTWCSSTR